MRVKRTKEGKRVEHEMSHREKLHYDPHFDVYWIVTLLPDGTQHIGSPFAITALDALYNASWGS